MIGIPVENPHGAACVLATLWERSVTAPQFPAEQWQVSCPLGATAAFEPCQPGAKSGVVAMLVRSTLPVEQIVAIACERGYHAEPTRRDQGLLTDFWIDENFLFEILSPESQDAVTDPGCASGFLQHSWMAA